jgi:hypothetical protein
MSRCPSGAASTLIISIGFSCGVQLTALLCVVQPEDADDGPPAIRCDSNLCVLLISFWCGVQLTALLCVVQPEDADDEPPPIRCGLLSSLA